MSNSEMDSVIRRIQKLLAHGGAKGTTEEEANNAMAMAQDLLAKYNLDMAVVREATVAGGTVPVKEKREKSKINKSAMYKWQQDLCRVIADCNFCYYWPQEFNEPYNTRAGTKHRRVKRHVIIGREVNSVAVTIMYEYLAEILEELLPYPNAERLSKSAISWREGCAERLILRIHRKFRERQEASDKAARESGGKMGLVLRSVYQSEYEANYDAVCGEGAYAAAVKRYKEERVVQREDTPEEKAKKQKEYEKWRKKQDREKERQYNNRDHEAYRKGQQVGETISLNDRIGEK